MAHPTTEQRLTQSGIAALPDRNIHPASSAANVATLARRLNVLASALIPLEALLEFKGFTVDPDKPGKRLAAQAISAASGQAMTEFAASEVVDTLRRVVAEIVDALSPAARVRSALDEAANSLTRLLDVLSPRTIASLDLGNLTADIQDQYAYEFEHDHEDTSATATIRNSFVGAAFVTDAADQCHQWLERVPDA